ncbi:Glycosyltransferase involved in cell wall bisynthesis [Pleomorphomonas diazotrophica]|nr:glycosyltransferase [Pleomorphomonas diazotrophica]SFM88213.1 Glycosyltransferase involved in cell wall bisynthesis [Pleomorphomonas diazotrophica]
MRVVLLTPWDQKCGNAEYSKHLVTGFSDEVEIFPIDLPNLMGTRRSFGDKYKLHKDFRRILQKINEIDPDIVHIQHEFVFFGSGTSRSCVNFDWFTKRLRHPFVVTMHTLPVKLLNPDKRKLLRRIDPRRLISRFHLIRAMERARGVILHSQSTQRVLMQATKSLSDKISVCPLPIGKVEGTSAGIYTKQASDVWLTIIGFVSRYKGHLSAVELLSHLPNNFKLVIAGGFHPKEGNPEAYWSSILSKADQLNLSDRILFTDFIKTKAEQSYYMERTDAFLLPYQEVGQSGSAVLADCMAYNVPIITSDAMSMIVYRTESDTCFSSSILFSSTQESYRQTDAQREVFDFSLAASQLERLFAAMQDQNSVQRKHRKTVQTRFSLEETCSRHLRIYNDVLGGKASGRN